MGRSLSFDLDGALDAAMRVFWREGYSAASLRDLLSATGLGQGSFYNTFKSKKQLFLQCLQRYAALELARRVDAIATAPTTADGLRAMYRIEFDTLDDPVTPSRMCMMVGMVSPDVLADPDLRQIVEAGRQRFEGLLSGSIRRDIGLGLLPVGSDADTMASIISMYGQGLSRLALVSFDRGSIERTTEIFLRGLGFPPER